MLAGGSQVAYAGGTLAFVSGKVTLVDSKGQSRAVREKERVETGDTLITGEDGEAHIITDDHGAIGLRPKSKLRIDEHVAEGNRNDRFIMTLYSGFMRSISGWISKTAPRNFEIRAANATVGIRGTDQEVGIVEAGNEPGVYNKVNSGGSVLRNAAGETPVNPGQAARSLAGLPAAPKVLPAIPAVFKATRNEKRINETKTRLELEVGEKLKTKQDEVKRANPARAACLGEGGPRDQLDAFIRAYESGNLAQLREMIDTRMPGYQRVLDDLVNDFNRQKQIRLLARDVNVQCGPDVASIQFSWEKRFLDVSKLTPGLFSGRSSMLMQRGANIWQVSALSGDNPFGSTRGVLAKLNFGPAFALDGISATPKTVPVNIEVIDPDRAGEGKVAVEIFSSTSDLETLQLNETSSGRFVLSTLAVSNAPPVAGNGVLSVANNGELTLRYIDPHPGANQPATTLTKVLKLTGTLSSNDTTPDAFSFATVNNVAPSMIVTSAAATITGINTAAPVSIAGGQYAINGGAFTSAAGTITNGQSVVVRVTAPGNSGASVSATLTIGGVSGTFTVNTRGVNTTPDAFTFPTVNDVTPGTNITSNTVMISGISAAASISIVGGQYAINGGLFTSAAGTITNGQSVVVQLTAPAMAGASATATLTVGGVSGVFTVNTMGADTTPDAFSFVPATNVTLGTIKQSNQITITGINTPAPISISGAGGAYSINGGAFTSAPGVINNNQTLRVRAVASNTPSTAVTTTVTVGGVSAGFKVTTIAMPDTAPDAFSFTTVNNAALNTLVTSANATITGINMPAPISIAGGGGMYSINNNPVFTAANGTINNGQTVKVQLTSPAVLGGTASTTLTIGGVSGTFTLNTPAIDNTPNTFTFTPQTGVAPNMATNSNVVTLGGFNVPVTITCNGTCFPGREYRVNGGPPTSIDGMVNSGDTVQVDINSSPIEDGTGVITVNLTVGGVTAPFTVTTRDTVPNLFNFPLVTTTAANCYTAGFQYQTAPPVTITGLTGPSPVTITLVGAPSAVNPDFSIAGGGFVTTGNITNGQTIVARFPTVGFPTPPAGSQRATVTIGGVSAPVNQFCP